MGPRHVAATSDAASRVSTTRQVSKIQRLLEAARGARPCAPTAILGRPQKLKRRPN
jgi:hypothetical protein